MSRPADQIPQTRSEDVKPLRFVTAASLFDGHDAAINIMRRLIQAQGAEVIHLGHNRSVLDIVRAAIQDAVDNNRSSVTLVHKGNIMKFTEGAFRTWGYEVVRDEFSDVAVGWDDCGGDPGDRILVKDVIADAFLQQILTRPAEYDVIATMNLNGDFISDALAAQVGGIGIAPGGNINYVNGYAVFEATHGTAPKYTGMDKVNPGSVILSGELMFRYMGWDEAADLIVEGMEGSIADKVVTYDFARLMDGATEVKTSKFANSMIEHMQHAD